MERFLERVSNVRIPIFLGILPLRSFKHAEFMHYEVPGIVVPEEIRNRMRDAKDRSSEVGTTVARDLLSKAKHMVDGVYLMPSFGRFEVISDVLQGFGLRAKP